MTLVLGTKTQASGKNLSAAKIVGAPVLTATNGSLALGSEILCAISGNSVVLTAYSALSVALLTDVSTYQVSLVGWT